MNDSKEPVADEALKTQTGEFLLQVIDEYEGQEVPQTVGAAVIHAFLTPVSAISFSCTLLKMKKGHGKAEFRSSNQKTMDQLLRIQSKLPAGLLEHLGITELNGYISELQNLLNSELTDENYNSVASSIELVCKDIKTLLQTPRLQKYQME